jgi:hypothetical protein
MWAGHVAGMGEVGNEVICPKYSKKKVFETEAYTEKY